MATGNVVVTVVDVGQGQCTFVEIYDTSGTPVLVHALLFDCGSDKKSDETETNLKYIATKVSSMAKPAFDCIFFSHSDKDHISLTYDLLQEFSSAKKPVVKEVWYGGAREKYTKYGFNILDYLEAEDYCDDDDIKTTGSNYTGYDTTSGSFTIHLWRSTDKEVYVYPIASNALSDDPDWDENDEDVTGNKAEELNRVSMICGLYYAGSSYVICGDATNKTMGAVNNLFIAGTTVIKDNNMTTLPHHGSRATGFAVKRTEQASAASKLVVKTFAGILKSQMITISAYEKHRHPSLELMNAFLPTITAPFLKDPRLKQANSHRVVAYIDIKLKQPKGWTLQDTVYSFDSTTCTFSTRYSEGMITYFYYNLGTTSVAEAKGATAAVNEFACWRFITKADGGVSLGGCANLKLPLVIFTVDADTLADGARIQGEQSPQLEEMIILPVKVRIKNDLRAIRPPSAGTTGFYTQLKQFH